MKTMSYALLAGLVFAGAACGRDDAAPVAGPASEPLALTAEGADLVCTGKATDGTNSMRVLAYKGNAEHYERVVVESIADPEKPAVLEALDGAVDTTPPPPTDINFRLVFGADAGYEVTLTHGGFTQQATVQIKQKAATIAWQTCLLQSAE